MLFLIASDVKDDVIDYLQECYREVKPVGDVIHNRIMKHFYRYLVVGGMPAAVKAYINTGDINRADIRSKIK